jgi:hypothetical protein
VMAGFISWLKNLLKECLKKSRAIETIGAYINKKKLTALWRVAYGFQKYWIYKNLLDGYLGHWTLLGDGPFNQLSDTKLNDD